MLPVDPCNAIQSLSLSLPSCVPDSEVRVAIRFRCLLDDLPPQSSISGQCPPVLVLHLCLLGVPLGTVKRILLPFHLLHICRVIPRLFVGIYYPHVMVSSVITSPLDRSKHLYFTPPPSTCVDRLVHYNVSSTVRSIQPWMMQLLSGDYSITCPPPSIAWQSFIQLSELKQQGERD